MASPEPRASARSDVLQSVQRACRALVLIAEAGRSLLAREVAEGLDMNLTTSYHLLNTLESEGFLVRDGSRRLRLGHRIGELSSAFADMMAPDPALIDFLEELNKRTGETSYLGAWRDDVVVSVAVREGRGGVRVRGLYLGYSEHTHARALGQALLAYRDDLFISHYLQNTALDALTTRTPTDPETVRERLAEIRETGVAVEREEFTAGVCCVAAPVFDLRGEPIASMSVSVPTSRFDADEDAIIGEIRAVSDAASAAFGGQPHVPAR